MFETEGVDELQSRQGDLTYLRRYLLNQIFPDIQSIGWIRRRKGRCDRVGDYSFGKKRGVLGG